LVFRFITYYHYEVYLGLLLLVFAWLASEYSSKNRWKNAGIILLSGMVLGWGALVSSKVIFLVFIFPVAALIGKNMMRLIYWPALLLGVLLVLTPWWVRNDRCFQKWIPLTTNGGFNLYVANNPYTNTKGFSNPSGNPGVPEVPGYESAVWIEAALDYMKKNPIETLERMAIRFIRFFNPHYGDQVPLILLFFIAIFRAIRAPRILRNTTFFFMLFIPISFLFLHTLFHYEFRYILPVWPVMAWIAVVGVSGWKEQNTA
jgi:hypothetical protein